METTTVASPSFEDKDHEIDSKAFVDGLMVDWARMKTV